MTKIGIVKRYSILAHHVPVDLIRLKTAVYQHRKIGLKKSYFLIFIAIFTAIFDRFAF